MPIAILHIHGHVLHTLDADSFAGADLRGKQLRGANLRGAMLHGPSSLELPDHRTGAMFDAADLTGADLTAADLSMASFRGTNLKGASFTGARLNWCSPDLIAEILRQAAGGDEPGATQSARGHYVSQPQTEQIERLQLAGLILLTRAGWDFYLSLGHPQEAWIHETLRPFMRDDERHHAGPSKLARRHEAGP